MISIVFISLLTPLLLHVCYSDIRYREIKNTTTITIAVISVLYYWIMYSDLVILPALYILLAGFLLSTFRLFGAGDVKLLAALSLSLSSETTLFFLFVTTLAGLPVALITLINHRCNKKAMYKTVPYGVAIVTGYIAAFASLKVAI